MWGGESIGGKPVTLSTPPFVHQKTKYRDERGPHNRCACIFRVWEREGKVKEEENCAREFVCNWLGGREIRHSFPGLVHLLVRYVCVCCAHTNLLFDLRKCTTFYTRSSASAKCKALRLLLMMKARAWPTAAANQRVCVYIMQLWQTLRISTTHVQAAASAVVFVSWAAAVDSDKGAAVCSAKAGNVLPLSHGEKAGIWWLRPGS